MESFGSRDDLEGLTSGALTDMLSSSVSPRTSGKLGRAEVSTGAGRASADLTSSPGSKNVKHHSAGKASPAVSEAASVYVDERHLGCRVLACMKSVDQSVVPIFALSVIRDVQGP